MKKYWLETYGCQMNIAESNALELQLKGAGLIPRFGAHIITLGYRAQPPRGGQRLQSGHSKPHYQNLSGA